jgi:hypothetical protein
MSSRIASKMTLNCASYFLSRASLAIPKPVPVVPIVSSLRSVQVVYGMQKQSNKGPHNFDVNPHGTLAPKDGRDHSYAPRSVNA